jgi:hypothetical protein
VSTEDEGVRRKHELLRSALDDLKGLMAAEASDHLINRARNNIDRIRNERSAAFKAAQPRKRRRRR